MILFLVLLNSISSYACYSASSGPSCASNNRRQAGEYSRQAGEVIIQQRVTEQAIASLQSTQAVAAQNLKKARDTLELSQAELSFLTGEKEGEPALFPGGPRLGDLPQFSNGLMVWDEMTSGERTSRLKKSTEAAKAEEGKYSADLAAGETRLATLGAELAALKDNETRLNNLVSTHNYNAESVCMEMCSGGNRPGFSGTI